MQVICVIILYSAKYHRVLSLFMKYRTFKLFLIIANFLYLLLISHIISTYLSINSKIRNLLISILKYTLFVLDISILRLSNKSIIVVSNTELLYSIVYAGSCFVLCRFSLKALSFIWSS